MRTRSSAPLEVALRQSTRTTEVAAESPLTGSALEQRRVPQVQPHLLGAGGRLESRAAHSLLRAPSAKSTPVSGAAAHMWCGMPRLLSLAVLLGALPQGAGFTFHRAPKLTVYGRQLTVRPAFYAGPSAQRPGLQDAKMDALMAAADDAADKAVDRSSDAMSAQIDAMKSQIAELGKQVTVASQKLAAITKQTAGQVAAVRTSISEAPKPLVTTTAFTEAKATGAGYNSGFYSGPAASALTADLAPVRRASRRAARRLPPCVRTRATRCHLNPPPPPLPAPAHRPCNRTLPGTVRDAVLRRHVR